ncbi:hypothetical protein BpHYR1_010011 [Brachionus plicatilis]|uniref:Uncharacterized protein n=1 Tax=Brachionus plicatilis TaxID=10195 RepID=A0A3M7Q2V5_BRAPC|nr:hypothetical protein BpHYR1_010011 [Brachionus plicatilis]
MSHSQDSFRSRKSLKAKKNVECKFYDYECFSLKGLVLVEKHLKWKKAKHILNSKSNNYICCILSLKYRKKNLENVIGKTQIGISNMGTGNLINND